MGEESRISGVAISGLGSTFSIPASERGLVRGQFSFPLVVCLEGRMYGYDGRRGKMRRHGRQTSPSAAFGMWEKTGVGRDWLACTSAR